MTFSGGGACAFSCAATVQVNAIRVTNITIMFLIDILDTLFPPYYAETRYAETRFPELSRSLSDAETQRAAVPPAPASLFRVIAPGVSIPDPGAPESAWISSDPRDRRRLDTY